ncbi:MAG: CHAT domain-containing protein [Nostoc sp.]|uniref:CHAT domain-containing protein n=1 Tax=Nostoc sp. TaxID=1180 RepID=UPI002FFA8E98
MDTSHSTHEEEKTKTILILTANPKGTPRLRLDQEVREIEGGLQRAQKRDHFKLEQRWAVRPRDVQRAMLDIKPNIVHFAGHGAGEEGLIFEDEAGQPKFVTKEALARLFELFAAQIECVVLNGCYSEVQAKAIAQHIPYVIGMQQAIGDSAAISFAVGFYDALGVGEAVEFAYAVGCNAIELEGLQESLTPVLLQKGKVIPRNSKYVLQQIFQEPISPTSDHPLLVGILVDVSWSMTTSIQNCDDKVQNRFEGFRESLHKVVNSTKEICQQEDSEHISPLLKLFTLGFGFGNPISFLLRGDSGDRVRDLLILQNTSESTTTISQLVNDWNLYERNIERISRSMFGDTPMGEALQKAEERLREEMSNNSYYKEPILFILSDGLPTDVSADEIIELTEQLKEKGIIIVSCYVTEKNLTKPRCLHGVSEKTWEEGAQLMFNCASVPVITSPFYSYFRELNWEIQENGRLFAQINETEFLEEFLKVIISPLIKSNK